MVTRNGSQTFRISLEPGEIEVLKRLITTFFDLFLASTSKANSHKDTNYNKKTESALEEAPF